jgi:lauroyl/myristoyl acyltransferase
MRDSASVPLPTDGRPIVFAANHTNAHDFACIAMGVNRYYYSMGTDAGLSPRQRATLSAYGVIWMDREDNEAAKASRAQATKAAISKLRSGINLLIFPEGVWTPRLTWIDGKALLPFHRGAIFIARFAAAQVVPVVTEYLPDKTCYVNLGAPFDYTRFGNDAGAATDALREVMSQTKQSMRSRLNPTTDEAFVAMRDEWRTANAAFDAGQEVRLVHGSEQNAAQFEQWFLR